MFFVIANCYKQKTKGPTLMELFTATGKLKKCVFFFFFFFDNLGCSLCAPRVAWTSSPSSSAVNGRPRDFCLHRHPVSVNCLYHARMVLSVGGSFCVLCTKCTLHSNHRLTVWYSNTQNDFSPGAAIFSLHTLASPSGRNVNYEKKNKLRGGIEMFLQSIQLL